MNVLVIDDDKVDRILVRELLQDDSFTIFEAESEVAARNFLNNQKIDCVLLDYLIPGTDSLALLSEISASLLPVIMLTGGGNEQVAVTAMKQGAHDYINKKNLSDELLTRTIINAVDTLDLKRKLEQKQDELVHANDQLKHSVAELQTLNSELENIIHITAHDLREPLKNLSCYCDLLERDLADNLTTQAKGYFATIKKSSKRLAGLIDDLRALTHVVHSDLTSDIVNLDEAIDEILSDLETSIKQKQVQINRVPLTSVRGTRPLIIELYRNLISNALKYGAEKDLILEFTHQKEGSVEVFGVKNTGTPIPAEETERIFQPFCRLARDKNKEGTGMGLALCRKIVKRHNGRIWIDSSESNSVHFKFTLGPDTHG